MTDLREAILETARAHAETARAAYSSRDAEVEALKARIVILENALDRARAHVQRLIEQLQPKPHL